MTAEGKTLTGKERAEFLALVGARLVWCSRGGNP